MLELSTSKKNSIYQVNLTGNLTGETYSDFNNFIDEILEQGYRFLVLDCSDLEYISSGGLSSLLYISKRVDELLGNAIIINPNDEILDLFVFLGIENLYHIFSELDEGISYLKSTFKDLLFSKDKNKNIDKTKETLFHNEAHISDTQSLNQDSHNLEKITDDKKLETEQKTKINQDIKVSKSETEQVEVSNSSKVYTVIPENFKNKKDKKLKFEFSFSNSNDGIIEANLISLNEDAESSNGKHNLDRKQESTNNLNNNQEVDNSTPKKIITNKQTNPENEESTFSEITKNENSSEITESKQNVTKENNIKNDNTLLENKSDDNSLDENVTLKETLIENKKPENTESKKIISDTITKTDTKSKLVKNDDQTLELKEETKIESENKSQKDNQVESNEEPQADSFIVASKASNLEIENEAKDIVIENLKTKQEKEKFETNSESNKISQKIDNDKQSDTNNETENVNINSEYIEIKQSFIKLNEDNDIIVENEEDKSIEDLNSIVLTNEDFEDEFGFIASENENLDFTELEEDFDDDNNLDLSNIENFSKESELSLTEKKPEIRKIEIDTLDIKSLQMTKTNEVPNIGDYKENQGKLTKENKEHSKILKVNQKVENNISDNDIEIETKLKEKENQVTSKTTEVNNLLTNMESQKINIGTKNEIIDKVESKNEDDKIESHSIENNFNKFFKKSFFIECANCNLFLKIEKSGKHYCPDCKKEFTVNDNKDYFF